MSRSDNLGDLVKANLYMGNINQRQDDVKAVFLTQTKRAIRAGVIKTLTFTVLCPLRCFGEWETSLSFGPLSILVLSRFRIFFISALMSRKKDTLSEENGILLKGKRRTLKGRSDKINYIRKFWKKAVFTTNGNRLTHFKTLGERLCLIALLLINLLLK